MRVAVGSDHAGFALKELAKRILAAESCEVLDVGTNGTEPVDYADFAAAVGAAVREHSAERGILLCGSGVGASMAANKIPGVRAGLCHDTYSAHQGVEHDDMNVLVLGGRIVGVELARELIHAFVNARFTGEPRHLRRLAKMAALENPLRALELFGQSLWLDHLRRDAIASGELGRLVEDDGVGGAIFEAENADEPQVIGDVQDAADALRRTFERTSGRDGYVSLALRPTVAFDTGGTVHEARRLWRAIGRANVMLAVPATAQGIPAIAQLVAEGINVNASLLFGRDAYDRVAAAYLAGIERLIAAGGAPGRVASVASFPLSHVDAAFDEVCAERLTGNVPAKERALLRSLAGKVAIAGAKLTYARYQEIFAGPRWDALAARGARPQRPLWATAGAASPVYADLAHLDALVGASTVVALPRALLDAFRAHGRPRPTLGEDLDGARDTMTTVAELGVPVHQVSEELLAAGVRRASETYERLQRETQPQERGPSAARVNPMTCQLPAPLAHAVSEALADWQAQGKTRRLWQRDATLWTGRDEAHWLGWLGIADAEAADLQRFARIAEVARGGEFSHVLLLGMGGSSLGPELLAKTFGRIDGFPQLLVLDSTDPAQVKALEQSVPLARTLFIVSSKSGSTLEPNIFEQYFFQRVAAVVGRGEAGRRFIAITDPESKMQHVAEGDGFRRVFFGWRNIGGRYSVLSDFGLVPAAVMGVDVPELLNRTAAMVGACMPSTALDQNPGVVLGIILGVAGERFGRNKVTLVASPGIASLGAWLEQLIAESTGKEGKGLIPIDSEAADDPAVYGDDRIFVYLRLDAAPEPAQDERVSVLERAGHPVIRIAVEERYDLGQELFRWEMATAVAGAVLGIHPFDQPDVEASKTATRRLTAAYEESGSLPAERPFFSEQGISLFTDQANLDALISSIAAPTSLAAFLAAHLGRLRPGDYFALLAYLQMSPAHERALQAIRDRVLAAKRVATCLEFGPRFLHSTGQTYKGGPNSGVFLQITCDDAADVAVPGQRYTFGVVKAAQARGDFEVLAQRERRALRVHLGPDTAAGLATLDAAVAAALRGA
jgi:transaldolase/glucose-6-phosphate isomerase